MESVERGNDMQQMTTQVGFEPITMTSFCRGKKGGVNPDFSGSSGGVISERERTLGYVTLQTSYIHKVIYNTMWDGENPQNHNRSSLSIICYN